MSMMMGNLYEALLEGGASSETARIAAEEVADYLKQLPDIPTDLAFVTASLGVAVTGILALVIKAFFA